MDKCENCNDTGFFTHSPGIMCWCAIEKEKQKNAFSSSFKFLQKNVHQNAVDHGWWEDDRSDGELIALIHSELSEALEYLRKDFNVSDHLLDFKGTEEEYADVIIRIMDHAEKRGWNIADAIIAKMQYNKTRPYKHGKKF